MQIDRIEAILVSLNRDKRWAELRPPNASKQASSPHALAALAARRHLQGPDLAARSHADMLCSPGPVDEQRRLSIVGRERPQQARYCSVIRLSVQRLVALVQSMPHPITRPHPQLQPLYFTEMYCTVLYRHTVYQPASLPACQPTSLPAYQPTSLRSSASASARGLLLALVEDGLEQDRQRAHHPLASQLNWARLISIRPPFGATRWFGASKKTCLLEGEIFTPMAVVRLRSEFASHR